MQLDQYIEPLILNSTLVESPSLIKGKLGISVFFFHYAQYTDNTIFEDYAADLIAEVQKQLHTTSPTDYESGLAGIGVGIEYLIQNQFLEADNDIFADFDKRLLHATFHELYPDLSIYDGLCGWGRYWLYRKKGEKKNKLRNRTDEALAHFVNEIKKKMDYGEITELEIFDIFRFLHEVKQLPKFADSAKRLLQRCYQWECIRKPDLEQSFAALGDSQIGKVTRLHFCRQYFGIDLSEKINTLTNEIMKEKTNEEFRKQTDMSLLKGLAGEAMYRLSMITNDYSWLKLL